MRNLERVEVVTVLAQAFLTNYNSLVDTMSVDVLVPHENHEAPFSCVLALTGKVVPAPERSRKGPFCVLGPYSARKQRACIGCAEGKTERPDSLTGLFQGCNSHTETGDFNSRALGRLKAVRRDTAQVTTPLFIFNDGVGGDFAVTLTNNRYLDE